MVIGNGLLANAFIEYKYNDRIIIFASGVSNSKEDRDEEFTREKELLKSLTSKKDSQLIYFSTCSIFDESLKTSKYINHKLEQEEYIKNNFDNFIIFRLPNVIGKTKNKNTFFNFFINEIKNNNLLNVSKNAYRYFIDIEDVLMICNIIINKNKTAKKTINIAFDNKISVLEIIDIMCSLLGVNCDKNILDYGYDYDIENVEIKRVLEEENIDISIDYNYNLIKKYIHE